MDKLTIYIHTSDGVYVIENVIITDSLFTQIENEFEAGDPITITYYSGNRVIGLKSETRTLLNTVDSIEKLQTENN